MRTVSHYVLPGFVAPVFHRARAAGCRRQCVRSQLISTDAGDGCDHAGSVLVTGSTDGIGLHTACNLASRGWRVFVHGRSEERGTRALQLVREATIGPPPQLITADLSNYAAVQSLADQVADACGTDGLDVLLNNAGVFETSRREAADGVEYTLAVNVLAPYMLANLLQPSLVKATRRTENSGGSRARIVNVSSISHMDGGVHRRGGAVDWDDLQQCRDYDAYGAYGLSKLLLLMITYAQAQGEIGTSSNLFQSVDALSLDPGTVNTKMLIAGWGACGIQVHAANDEAWTATSSEARNGKYYVRQQERRSAAITYDVDSRRRLLKTLDELIESRR